MNYLDICKSVRILSGAQGVGPSSVVGASGYEAALVSFVKDAWIDIQNLREDWNFLEDKKSFNTVVGKDNYTIAEIFQADSSIFKVWKKDNFVITTNGTKKYLNHTDAELFDRKWLNNSSTGDPTQYAINSNHSISIGIPPSSIFSIDTVYYKSPQILVIDTDVPTLPVAYHNLIVYRALQKMSIYLSTPEIFRGYATEADRLAGSLLRSECPVKRVKNRRRRIFA